MALSKAKVREILSEAGVDSEHMTAAVESIIDGHTASISALREERDAAKDEFARLKSENDRLTAELQKANENTEKAKSDAKTSLESAKADADKRVQSETDKLAALQREMDALKADYETAQTAVADLTKVKSEYEAYKTEQEAKATTASKEEAFKSLLQDMNLSDRGIYLAMKYTSMDDVELNDKGKISNAAALRKSVTDDWKDYIQEDVILGADTATPPANNPVSGKSAAEILAIEDDAERFKAIEANPAAFGLA